MKTCLLVVLILICSACQSGRIPCPDARGPRIKKVKVPAKHHPEYMASVAGRRASPENKTVNQFRDDDERFVRNISLEEWDCPRPGEKKYMPKSIKDNIRKNMKRIKSGDKRTHESDSVRSR